MRANTESGNVVSSHSSACGASSLVTNARIDSRSRSCSSLKMKCRCDAAKSGLRTSAAGVLMKVDSRTSHFRWQPRPPGPAYGFFFGGAGARSCARSASLRSCQSPRCQRCLEAALAGLLTFFSADFLSFRVIVAVRPARIENDFDPSVLPFRLIRAVPLQRVPTRPVQDSRTLTRRLLSRRSLRFALIATRDLRPGVVPGPPPPGLPPGEPWHAEVRHHALHELRPGRGVHALEPEAGVHRVGGGDHAALDERATGRLPTALLALGAGRRRTGGPAAEAALEPLGDRRAIDGDLGVVDPDSEARATPDRWPP